MDSAEAASSSESSGAQDHQSVSFGEAAPDAAVQLPEDGDSGFEISESPGLDWNRYQTGALSDLGFVTVPGDTAIPANGQGADSGSHAQGTNGFRYSDTLMGDPSGREGAPVADMVFNSASLLPSDTMPRVLRDELEGIDFYIAQGYVEIARDTLDRLRIENGEHPEILARYNRLGGILGSVAPELIEPESTEALVVEPSELVVEPAELVDGVVLMAELPTPEGDDEPEEMLATEFEITVSDEEPEDSEGEQVGAMPAETDKGPDERKHFFIQKESGPLYADLVVDLNS